jgi:hypothetical protein
MNTRANPPSSLGAKSLDLVARNPFQPIADIKIGGRSLGELATQGAQAAGQWLPTAQSPARKTQKSPKVGAATPSAPGPKKISTPMAAYTGRLFGGEVSAKPEIVKGRLQWTVQHHGPRGTVSFKVPLSAQFRPEHLATGSYTKNTLERLLREANAKQVADLGGNTTKPLIPAKAPSKHLARQVVDGALGPAKDFAGGTVGLVKDLLWDKPRALGYQVRDGLEGSFNPSQDARYAAQARFNERLAPGYNAIHRT